MSFQKHTQRVKRLARKRNRAPLAHQPQFNPFLFTLNQLLPVGNFNQQNLFAPKGIYLWIADIISALGLVLGLTVFAGIGRVLSRD